MLPLALVLLLTNSAGVILETRLHASVLENGSVEAEVLYRLDVAPDTVRLPLRLLVPSESRLGEIEAFVGDRPAAVVLEPSLSAQREGQVELPEPAAGRIELELRYVAAAAAARGGGELTARFPLPVVGLPQTEARADAFTCSIALPEGVELVESFPSGLARSEASTTTYTGRLPLVPAFVAVRGAPGGTLLSFEGAVDLASLALLVGLGALGMRRGLGASR